MCSLKKEVKDSHYHYFVVTARPASAPYCANTSIWGYHAHLTSFGIEFQTEEEAGASVAGV